MRIVIVGLGNTGRELLKTLTDKGDNEVVLIESDEDVAEIVSEAFDVVTITGDGSNPEVLKQAKLDEADALIAVTDSDAINLVIAMIAQRWEVERIAVKLSRSSLIPAGKEMVKDITIVMPHASAANAIVQSIYGREGSNIAEAIGGALYQDIVEVDEGASEKVGDLDLPEDCLAIAVQRGDEVLLATADRRLQKDDRLVVLSKDEKTIERIRTNMKRKGDDHDGG